MVMTDYYTDEAIKAIAANKSNRFPIFGALGYPHTIAGHEEDYEAVGDNFPDHRSRICRHDTCRRPLGRA